MIYCHTTNSVEIKFFTYTLVLPWRHEENVTMIQRFPWRHEENVAMIQRVSSLGGMKKMLP
jgi:hypothetical protein